MGKLNVVLDWFANTNHTGFLLAEKRGYFAEAGLEVHIDGEVHGVMDLHGADFVLGPQISMLDCMSRGVELTGVAVLTQRSDSGIVSLKESGITSPRHLEGKRLTHWAPRWFHGVIGEAVRLDGGDYGKVELVPMDVGDIVAPLGTVADVMELTGENRTIVRRGLTALSRTARPGLRALLREAGAEGKALSSISIGYTLAPRVNAAGRMGRAEVAEELLLTSDPARAEALAKELCELNHQRQELERDIFDQCDLLVDALPAGERDALVLAGDTWHQGVVGIVASRLTEKYAVPAFMICLQDGRGKGSCRSYGGLNLFALLEGCGDLLESYGGHELAAGFTILEEHIPAFRARVNDLARQARNQAEPVTVLTVDCVLPDASLLTQAEVEGLSLLEPYGPGNQKPVFRLDGCTVAGLTQVGNGKHMKLKLSVSGGHLDAIFFSATMAEAGINPGDRVDVCFYPQINEYRGWRNVQLQVCDLRPARTRAQAEEELFRRLMEGEALSRSEAAALLPSRQEFANLWRYLRSRRGEGCIEETAQRLARNVARSCGLRETFMRTEVCLAVFHDRGLIRVERATDHLRIQIRDTVGKVDLESSELMRQLRRLADRS